ncbi:MAG: hypothetical protein JSV80_08350 [Acidobacteriota bacterium]|nr:MAG: hypothetical protein JSV80_08350 [Acidobacteriota bacterium]
MARARKSRLRRGKQPADPPLSALVWLRPASGREICADEPISSENIRALSPDPDEARRVRTFFIDAGFDVLPAVGPLLSIIGPKSLFENVFERPLVVRRRRDAIVSVRTREGALELPLERIEPSVAVTIHCVTFSAPPDFGPSEAGID